MKIIETNWLKGIDCWTGCIKVKNQRHGVSVKIIFMYNETGSQMESGR